VFSKHYQSELTFLREMGRAFGLANPAIAGLLVERGADPDVERLLEGFAFLTARIRERIEQALPEVIHPLTDLIFPHYLRPLPACSIVEFTPLGRSMRARTRIEAGAELGCNPVDGTRCLFRTTQPVELLPLTLLDAQLEQTPSQGALLRLSFSGGEQSTNEIFHENGIRLFIQGELPMASTLILWLQRYCRNVQVREAGASGTAVSLGPTCLRWAGFGPEAQLLPWPERAPDTYRHLQELFTLPQKFLFFDVLGLQAARGAVNKEKFELLFSFERPPPLPSRVGKDLFRLHCAPVINLFSTTADPLRQTVRGEEHFLRAAGVDPSHMEIYSVQGVSAIRPGQAARAEYRSFFDYAHTTGADGYYRVRRSPSPLDDGFDTYLCIDGEGTGQGQEETLSVDLLCTNRSLPRKLQVGDISVSTPASPSQVKFKNIAPLTRPLRPPLDKELHWRLLSHLALNQRSLGDAQSLKALLDLYNFQTGADHAASRANQLRIQGIANVELSPARRVLSGSLVRGTRARIELDEAGFAGAGDAYIFGAVLNELFAASVTLNSFTELSVKLQPINLEYAWPARSGAQALL
jgi:type VI secretion system protein ImpG